MNEGKCECGAVKCGGIISFDSFNSLWSCSKCSQPIEGLAHRLRKVYMPLNHFTCGTRKDASKCVKHEKHIDDWFARRYWHESSQENGYSLNHDDVGYLKNTIRALETKIVAHSLAQPNALPFVESRTGVNTGKILADLLSAAPDMTENEMGNVGYPRPDAEHQKYLAKVYRSEPVIRKIEEDVEVMIYALLNHETDNLRIERLAVQRENPEGEYFQKHHWSVHKDEWFATGRTRGEALCRFLGVILDSCWTPKT